MKFTKMHGCGNDYVYVNVFEEQIKDENQFAIKVSDRHFGIGSDGLITIGPSEVADFRMRMYNADGSEGNMCGNGIRCVGKYVYDHGMTDQTTVTVETKSGIKTLKLHVTDGKVDSVRVNMGAPVLEAEKIPAISPSGSEKVIHEMIQVEGKEYPVTCVSMGNPHCITQMPDVMNLDIEKIGPAFEHHAMFPDRVNTEFIEILSRSEVNMRVWERGSGETLACGTGACATAVACIVNGLTDDRVLVHLVGGDLHITYDRNENTVYLEGPATTVFTGEIEE
ncbi:MAG: diaminopimelate epimerase [Lachnospiraceae bacterium]|nr:diaminopimelate epimerase [Lachnospiraceae bacterium]